MNFLVLRAKRLASKAIPVDWFDVPGWVGKLIEKRLYLPLKMTKYSGEVVYDTLYVSRILSTEDIVVSNNDLKVLANRELEARLEVILHSLMKEYKKIEYGK